MSQEAFDQIQEKNVKASKVSSSKTNKLRNVSDFIWSKLTNSRKNSSLNITKTSSETKLMQSATVNQTKGLIIGTTNDKNGKKNRRNIFNIFESSSKLRLNSGVNKKSHKINKSPNKKQFKSETEISISKELSEKAIPVEKNEEPEPDLDSLKIVLMDNSLLKSKISAAKRNPRMRKTSAQISASNLSSLNPYQTIEIKTSLSKLTTEVIDENSTNVDKSLSSASPVKKSCEKIEINDSTQLSSKEIEQNSDNTPEPEEEMVKIAIYDNNISQCSNYDEKSSSFELFETLGNQFKSKSCEKIQIFNCSTDSNNNYGHLKNANNQQNFNYIKNNRYSYFDGNSDKIDLGKVMLKSLSHSRSLKLNQNSPDSSQCESMPDNDADSSVSKSVGKFSSSYKIPNSKKRMPIISKFTDKTEEPVWKELAFRKHNAWSRKNPDYSPNSDKQQEKLEQDSDQVSIGGKVKSMVRDFQKT